MSLFMRNIGLWFSFLTRFLYGFCYQNNASILGLGSVLSSSVFWKRLYKIKNTSSLHIAVGYQWNVWTWSFVCWKVFSYEFHFFNRYKTIQVLCFFLSMLWKLVSFKELSHFFWGEEFMGMKLFVVIFIIIFMFTVISSLSFLILIICLLSF